MPHVSTSYKRIQTSRGNFRSYSILPSEVSDAVLKRTKNAAAFVKKASWHECQDGALLLVSNQVTAIGVFDGLGQHVGSEHAVKAAIMLSELTADRFLKRLIKEEILTLIDQMSIVIQAKNGQNSSNSGTTVTLAVLFPDGNYCYGNVGDSHLYKITDGGVKLVTKQTRKVTNIVELLDSRGAVEQALGGRGDPDGTVKLTADVDVDYGEGKLEKGQSLMAVTDGIIDMLYTVRTKMYPTTGKASEEKFDINGEEDLSTILKTRKRVPAQLIRLIVDEVEKRLRIELPKRKPGERQPFTEETIRNTAQEYVTRIIRGKDDDQAIVIARH